MIVYFCTIAKKVKRVGKGGDKMNKEMFECNEDFRTNTCRLCVWQRSCPTAQKVKPLLVLARHKG